MRKLHILGIAVVSLLVIAGCGPSFSSNGQRIYFTATSNSGERITYYGGLGMMMRFVCANCHGPQGHGGRIAIMMQTLDVPNITWPELTAQDMDHPAYTEETLKRAITQSLDPAGNPLEYPMPRWQMSEQDLNDLASFIKTLK
jgi:cytochrome c553